MQIYIEDYVGRGPLSKEPKKEYEVESACTLGELVKAFQYEEFYIVVNRRVLPFAYILQEGDTVTMIPHLTGG